MSLSAGEGFLERFAAASATDPERRFAWCDGRWLTLGELDGNARSMAGRLRQTGVRRGERVVTMVGPGAVSLTSAFGLARAGALWLPLSPALTAADLRQILGHAEPRLAICEPAFEARLREAWPAPDADAAVLAVHDVETLLRAAGPPGEPPPTPAPSDPFLLIYTSGTTGAPKGAIVTHRMMRLAGEGAALASAAGDGDVLYLWEPLYHIGGAQMLVLPLLRRAPLWITAGFDAGRFWPEVVEAGATHVHYLGGILAILARAAPGPLDRAHRLRVAWGGGATQALADIFRDRFGVAIHEAYGLTEAASFSACRPGDFDGSVGLPVPWTQIDILDEAGAALPAGQSGEIVLRGRGEDFFAGYFRDPEATARVFRPDGLHTGDRGRRDRTGRLFYEGRLSDVFRVRGENVAAADVERVAASHGAVEDCALTGVAGEFGDQDLVLHVKPVPGVVLDMRDLADWLGGRLAPHQTPRYYRRVEAFERTPSQRIIKSRLPQTSEGCWDRFASLSGADRLGGLAELVRRAWRRVLRDGENAARSFADSGGDSLSFLKLAFLIEEAAGLAIPLERWSPQMSLDDIITLLASLGSGEPATTATAARTIILLPGGGGDSPLLAGLRTACRPAAAFVTLALPDWRRIVLAAIDAPALLDDLVRQVAEAQIAGPLRFVGFSTGSALAYALAHRLASTGRPVAEVVLIDGTLAVARRHPTPLWRLWTPSVRRRLARLVARLDGRTRAPGEQAPWLDLRDTLTDLGARALFALRRTAAVRGIARAPWARLPVDLDYYLRQRLTVHFQSRLAAALARDAVGAGPLAASIHLFRTEEHPPGAPRDLGWGKAGGSLRVTALAGGHFDSLRGPNLNRIAAYISTGAGNVTAEPRSDAVQLRDGTPI